jgi:hypothetical protein
MAAHRRGDPHAVPSKMLVGAIVEKPIIISAVEKLAVAGGQAGFSVEQMIELLNAGMSVESLVELIARRLNVQQPVSPPQSSRWTL